MNAKLEAIAADVDWLKTSATPNTLRTRAEELLVIVADLFAKDAVLNRGKGDVRMPNSCVTARRAAATTPGQLTPPRQE